MMTNEERQGEGPEILHLFQPRKCENSLLIWDTRSVLTQHMVDKKGSKQRCTIPWAEKQFLEVLVRRYNIIENTNITFVQVYTCSVADISEGSCK